MGVDVGMDILAAAASLHKRRAARAAHGAGDSRTVRGGLDVLHGMLR